MCCFFVDLINYLNVSEDFIHKLRNLLRFNDKCLIFSDCIANIKASPVLQIKKELQMIMPKKSN